MISWLIFTLDIWSISHYCKCKRFLPCLLLHWNYTRTSLPSYTQLHRIGTLLRFTRNCFKKFFLEFSSPRLRLHLLVFHNLNHNQWTPVKLFLDAFNVYSKCKVGKHVCTCSIQRIASVLICDPDYNPEMIVERCTLRSLVAWQSLPLLLKVRLRFHLCSLHRLLKGQQNLSCMGRWGLWSVQVLSLVKSDIVWTSKRSAI